ncbi:MAG: hypothetical protein FJW96_15845, partial [Actinobacteria bacterium]|nr:hypothetical protein [Actinomycetota bacterium]
MSGDPLAGRAGTARRVGLGLFFGSVAVNAALGIVGLVAGDLGDVEGKLLGTSLCVTGAIVVGLLCVPAWERGRLGPVPATAAACGTLAFTLLTGTIWADGSDNTTYDQLLQSLFVTAAAGVVASLLALAILVRRHEIVLRLAYVLTAASAIAIVTQIWADIDSEAFSRLVGVLLVLLAAFAVTIPVMHRLDRDVAAGPDLRSEGSVRFCPFCGERATGEQGERIRCESCWHAFV